MVWRPTRIILNFMVVIFAIILIGLTSSRIHFTHQQPIGFFEPITADILATSIIAFLWSLAVLLLLAGRVGGSLASFFIENIMYFLIWVLYLVANAIYSHKFAHIGHCRRFAEQCRVITAILAFAWINWAIYTFLIVISLAHMATAGAGVFDPMYSEKGEIAPETRERPVAA
ncbi:hypothetical protein M378DRAFT_12495 [Amanita muscaria Koide BX008]|uniref:MARVEL domain-containing protein n=1 Tax=Amanita muscaria (strain Koide BX008) TaxID=946122 RepID=A0A0C2X1J2_AMAMK|nr:hypothetical protein M378DRAFT_12495 [Amanita muscaria Koide BX008]